MQFGRGKCARKNRKRFVANLSGATLAKGQVICGSFQELGAKFSLWLIPLKQVSLYVVDLKALGVEKR